MERPQLSTPPPQYPGYQQTPGPYQQTPPAPGPYQQPQGGYPQAPGPYQQPAGPYAAVAPAPAPASAWPQQYGAGMPAGGPGCEVCGAAPAAQVTIRGHQGMIVIMRSLRRRGTFCHTCALASFREMQTDTMLMGWWGPMSAFITPIVLLINLAALSGIRRIPAPMAPGWRPPLDPGKPVFRRPAGIVALIPLSLVGLAVLSIPILMIIGLLAGN